MAQSDHDVSCSSHQTEVEGYGTNLKLLTERIHGMRYDAVEKFYAHTVEELQRQAAGDRGRERHQLAALLEESAELAKRQQEQFAKIFALCKPYME